MVETPENFLEYTGFAGTGWERIFSATYSPLSAGVFNPASRHAFNLERSGSSILATKIRIMVGEQGLAIDEFEVYGSFVTGVSLKHTFA